MIDVKNKYVLITGGSRGVGRLIAHEMAKLGANIIIQARIQENADTVLKELYTINSNITAISYGCHLENEFEIDDMLKKIDSLGVNVDIVFNNAGMLSQYFEDYTTNTMEDFHKAMAVNFFAPVKIAYHFLGRMINRGFGRIQFTVSGIVNQPEYAAYSCAKAALKKYVKDYANKLTGTDVIMNVLDPGSLKTGFNNNTGLNPVESVIPGALVGALIDDKISGRWFYAQEFKDLSLEEAIKKGYKYSPMSDDVWM